MSEKSKILFIGGTGYIGKFLVEASAASGHPTFALVRQSTLSSSDKAPLIAKFKSLGVNIIPGDLYDAESLLNAVKEVDVVISAVGFPQLQPGLTSPPRDKVVILGDGNPKAVFNKEEDIATYTIRAVEDPRTVNKNLYIRPPLNILSFNDLVSLWEKKIGKTLERVYVSEEEILKQIPEAPAPRNLILAIVYSVFVKGDHTNFEIESSFGVEASELYPDVKYTTVDEYLNQFV